MRLFRAIIDLANHVLFSNCEGNGHGSLCLSAALQDARNTTQVLTTVTEEAHLLGRASFLKAASSLRASFPASAGASFPAARMPAWERSRASLRRCRNVPIRFFRGRAVGGAASYPIISLSS